MDESDRPVMALTGATGFLGSHLMVSLLERGYRLVILGRSSGNDSLPDRILRLLRWFGMETYFSRLELAEVNFCAPRCGMPESRYARLCAMTSQIIHCASDTRFAERNRSKVFESNVEGLNGILAFAADAQVAFLHYIGTAYAAGHNAGMCPEALPTATTFTNVYEESKACAERVLVDYCREHRVPLKIIRPTIVYGDSSTGRTLKFNALYQPIKSLQYIRNLFMEDLQNHNGEKAQAFQIYLDKAGFLHLPMKLYLPRDGYINLIPVDYFVNAVLAVMEHPADNLVYQVASDTPLTMSALSEYTLRYLKVKGVELVYAPPDEQMPRSTIETLFDRFIEPYRPYLSDIRRFEWNNTRSAVGGMTPPVLTYELFSKCMDYAMAVEWGKRLFEEESPACPCG